MFQESDPFKAGPALVAIAVLAVAALFSSPSQATPQPLSETEMSAVRGADGSIFAGLQAPQGNGAQNPFSNGLAAAFASSTGPTLLNSTEFNAALQAAGWPAGVPMPGYDGQPVLQTKVDAAPVTFSFDLSAVLQSTTGLAYNGASMGTITMRDFDARGTTLWVWRHP
jgi:hypothetical protein